MKQEIRVYDDWSGGHWGSIGPFKAPDNMYRSVNLQRYANGTLGPRPGWKLLNTTGDAPAPASGTGSEFYGMLWVTGVTGGGHLVFVSKSDSTATKRLNMDSLVWSSLSSIGAPTNDMLLGVPAGGNIHSHHADHILVGGHKWTNVNTDVGSYLTFPAGFSPRSSVPYKGRMYFWGDTTYKNRIYYSDATNPGIISTGNYFDVGFDRSVVGCWEMRDSLLILVLVGNIVGRQSAAEWWSLQGANPITGSLRRLMVGEWPYVPEYAIQFRDTLLWMDVLYDRGFHLHNGTDLDSFSLIRLSGRTGSDTVGGSASLTKPTATYGEPSIVSPYVVTTGNTDPTGRVIGKDHENGLQGWELVNGSWTKSSYWDGAVDEVVGNRVPFLWAITDWEGRRLIACTNTSLDGSGEFKFFSRDVTLNRPTAASDPFSDRQEDHSDIPTAGGGLDCRLWLTPIQADEGSGVRITRVVVDFDYWNNGDYFPNIPKIGARVVNYRQNRGWSGETQELVADLSALEESPGRLPGRGRYVFRFPDSAWYSASQVYFTALDNVAIDRVSVHYDRNPKEPQ